jgi:hypothetical protein
MSSEIALRETDSWAPILPNVIDLAKNIHNTDFVPTKMRGNAPAVAACILTGREIGIGPMESLQKIFLIEGKPALSAELMRSQVLKNGHSIKFTTLTDTRVTIEGKRAGEDNWTAVTWTIAEAQRAGVASKDVWKKYPRNMLSARATSELCRLIFPDALGGISYTPEEIENEDAEAGSGAVVRVSNRVQRAKAPDPVEPSFDADIVESDEDSSEISRDSEENGSEIGSDIENDTPNPSEKSVHPARVVEEIAPDTQPKSAKDLPSWDGITAGQVKAIGALMGSIGLTNRANALLFCADVIGHEIGSRNDLSKDEAGRVIDALSKIAPGAE